MSPLLLLCQRNSPERSRCCLVTARQGRDPRSRDLAGNTSQLRLESMSNPSRWCAISIRTETMTRTQRALLCASLRSARTMILAPSCLCTGFQVRALTEVLPVRKQMRKSLAGTTGMPAYQLSTQKLRIHTESDLTDRDQVLGLFAQESPRLLQPCPRCCQNQTPGKLKRP